MMVEMGGGGVCLGRDVLMMPGEWRGEPCKYMVNYLHVHTVQQEVIKIIVTIFENQYAVSSANFKDHTVCHN